jgi:hypothetical protein
MKECFILKINIYTSYFGNLRKLPKDIVPISICGKAPDWYKGLQYKKLAPKYGFFQKWKETRDNDYYTECFDKEVLQPLTPQDVIQELLVLAKTQYGENINGICLICYEKPEDFCHRHQVAKWFNVNGYNVTEY